MSETASNTAALISVEPPVTLTFKLERGTQPRTILKVSNVSSNKVVFKVKTTQPTWYYVRPNQQILDVGQSEDVNILLVDSECNRFLDQLASNINNIEKVDKHRFLVQSKAVDDEEFQRIQALPNNEKTDELSKLWEGPKDDKRNVKLKVEFKYPENLMNNIQNTINVSSNVEQARAATSGGSTISDNIEAVRNKLNPKSEHASSTNMSSSPEVLFSELQNLRKKYDAVVDYTVHLTSERDSIVNQLDTTQRELNKERSKKKEGSSGAKDKGEKRVVEKGFSLFVVILTAIIAFVLGKYLR